MSVYCITSLLNYIHSSIYLCIKYIYLSIYIHLFVLVTLGDGRIFTWGAGHYGRLGQGNLRDRYSPLWVDNPLRGIHITHIACYDSHSAAISG